MGATPVVPESSCVESASPSTRGNSVNVPNPSGPQDGSSFHSNLPSGFSAFLKLAILSIISLAFTVWFIYTEPVNPAPVPKYMVLSPGTTRAIIAFLSHLVTIIIIYLAIRSYIDAVFHLLTTGANGVSPWLSISNDGTAGLIKYIKAIGAPYPLGFWLLQPPILCTIFFLPSSILLAGLKTKTTYATVMNGTGVVAIDVVAGLTQYIQVDEGNIVPCDYTAFDETSWTDSRTATEIEPWSCAGDYCTSVFLPGGLDLVRLRNGTPYTNVYEDTPVTLINDAPGYQLDFSVPQEDLMFDSETDCTIYYDGFYRAISLCISTNGSEIIAGWSACPAFLHLTGSCLDDTNWTVANDESTVLAFYKRYATVVYDGSDSSIIDIESLREPELEEEPINSYFISTLTRMLSCALDRISNNDLESQADAGSWHAEYDATVAEIPMDLGQNNNSFAEFQIGSGHLKGLLIMSFQLTTSAWQFADLDSLPSELKTTAFPATLVHRAFIKARSLLLFVGAESAMIVWAVLILVSPNILLFGAGTYPKAPNSPEGLSAGKSMIQKIDATKPGLVKIFMRSITELCMHRSWRWNGRIETTKICVDNGRPHAGPTESFLCGCAFANDKNLSEDTIMVLSWISTIIFRNLFFDRGLSLSSLSGLFGASLRKLSHNLKSEASSFTLRDVAGLIGSEAELIASKVCMKLIDAPEGEDNRTSGKQFEIKFKKQLETKHHTGTLAEGLVSPPGESCWLDEVALFLFSSRAYGKFKNEMIQTSLRLLGTKSLNHVSHGTSIPEKAAQVTDLQAILQPKGPRYQEQDAEGIADHLSGTRVLKYDRIFELTPWDLVHSLTLIERMKQTIQQQVNFPIIWWPLKPGSRSCEKGHVRISWKCICGTDLFVDVTSKRAEDFVRTCAPMAVSPARPILPLHTQQSTPPISPPSQVYSIRNQKSEGADDPFQNSSKTVNRSGPAASSGRGKGTKFSSSSSYLHWCVDKSSSATILFPLNIPRIDDVTIIQKLKSKYKAVKGLRRWVSLTDCDGVRFVLFKRGAQKDGSKELIVCLKEELPPKSNPNYTYLDSEPPGLLKDFAAQTLRHHLHYPHQCSEKDMEDVMLLVPKKVNGLLERKFGVIGWGIQAVPGLAIWKCFVALLLSQIPTVIFAVRWLLGHPGDLQNAFLFSFYIVGLLNVVIIIPDRWCLQKDPRT